MRNTRFEIHLTFTSLENLVPGTSLSLNRNMRRFLFSLQGLLKKLLLIKSECNLIQNSLNPRNKNHPQLVKCLNFVVLIAVDNIEFRLQVSLFPLKSPRDKKFLRCHVENYVAFLIKTAIFDLKLTLNIRMKI